MMLKFLRRSRRRLGLVISLLMPGFVAIKASAQEQPLRLRLGEYREGDLIGDKLKIYEDRSSQMSLVDVMSEQVQTDFRPSANRMINFGFSDSSIWLKLEIENPSSETVQLFLENAYPVIDSFRLYAQDAQGKWIGKVAGDREVLTQVDVPENRNPTFLLEVKPGLSSYYFLARSQGSIQIPMKLWTKDGLSSKMLREYSALAILYGFFSVMILYNFFLFIWLRSVAYFYYVVFIGASTLNMLNLQGFTQVLFPRGIGVALSSNLASIANLTMALSLVFSSLFLDLKSSARRLYLFFLGMMSISVVGMASALFSYNVSIKIYILSNLAGCILLMTGGIYQSIKGFRPAYFFTLAWFAIMVGHVSLTLSAIGVLPVNFITSFGAFIGSAIEVVLLSLAMGDKMRFEQQKSKKEIAALFEDLQRKNIEITSLNNHLEQKVEDKTRNIRSILKSIRQGIFMMDSDRTIMAETSDFLREIFEEEHLEGRDAFEILFGSANLSKDIVDRAASAFSSCMQESILMFDINAHLLCQGASFTNKRGEHRILQYDWSPMTKDGIVDRMLVTVKDVTEQVNLENDHLQKSEELKILGEIVNIDRSIFVKFTTQSQRLLSECQEMLNGQEELKAETLRKVFVNLHTIKGSARSLYLETLAGEVHEAEQHVQTCLRSKSGGMMPQFRKMFAELEGLWKKYISLADEKLGMNQLHQNIIECDKVEVCNLLLNIERISTKKAVQPSEMQRIIADHRNFFYRHIYTDLHAVMRGMHFTLRSAAKDLGKSVPELVLDSDRRFVVTAEGEDLLNNIFIHILRNSVDHGIESDQERIAMGKRLPGRIEVRSCLRADKLCLVVSDDGLGLDLSHILDKARHIGLVTPDEELSDENIAELIFQPGFSTRETSSLLSGRGVGMDAIRTYLEERQGRASIRLQDSLQPGSEGRSFTLEILIPQDFFRVLDSVQLAKAS